MQFMTIKLNKLKKLFIKGKMMLNKIENIAKKISMIKSSNKKIIIMARCVIGV